MNIDPTSPPASRWRVTRRGFLKASGAASLSLAHRSMAQGADGATLRFGLVTDLHYADVDRLGTRHYRESAGKLRECVAELNKQDLAFMCELGDFKDEDRASREEADTLRFLDTIEAEYAAYEGPRHYVLGNHDLDSISKAQFRAHTGMEKTYYSFDAHDRHFVILDADYTTEGADYDHGNFDWKDSNVPAQELEWLADDLEKTNLPTIILAHQRLDGSGALFVNNAPEVRSVLEDAGNVLAVFQGHDHVGDHNTINGIHYYTLIAVVEGSGESNNSYAVVEIAANQDIEVVGYRRAADLKMKKATA